MMREEGDLRDVGLERLERLHDRAKFIGALQGGDVERLVAARHQ